MQRAQRVTAALVRKRAFVAQGAHAASKNRMHASACVHAKDSPRRKHTSRTRGQCPQRVTAALVRKKRALEVQGAHAAHAASKQRMHACVYNPQRKVQTHIADAWSGSRSTLSNGTNLQTAAASRNNCFFFPLLLFRTEAANSFFFFFFPFHSEVTTENAPLSSPHHPQRQSHTPLTLCALCFDHAGVDSNSVVRCALQQNPAWRQ